MKVVKIIVDVLGILAIVAGAIWFLQGINFLPGSPMSGQTQWAINGIIAVVVGVVLLVAANWQRFRGGRSDPHGMTPQSH